MITVQKFIGNLNRAFVRNVRNQARVDWRKIYLFLMKKKICCFICALNCMIIFMNKIYQILTIRILRAIIPHFMVGIKLFTIIIFRKSLTNDKS